MPDDFDAQFNGTWGVVMPSLRRNLSITGYLTKAYRDAMADPVYVTFGPNDAPPPASPHDPDDYARNIMAFRHRIRAYMGDSYTFDVYGPPKLIDALKRVGFCDDPTDDPHDPGDEHDGKEISPKQ